MKKIAYLFSATALIALTMLTSCKKDDDEPTVDNNPNAPEATATMTTSNQGLVETSIDVNNATGTAKIKLDVTHTGDLDKIYIMKSEDNGSLTAQVFSSITTSDSKTFTGGSADYSFTVPSSTKSFVLEFPVTVRSNSSAVTDVYYIWITNGNGNFILPTKNRVLGAAKVTLKYNSSASTVSYSTSTVNIGDQTATPGSLLVTSGQISALLTASYNEAPSSADLSVSALNVGGTAKENGSANIYLVSPDQRIGLGYTTDPTSGVNFSYIETYSGGDFATITGSQLQSLTVSSSSKKVLIASSGVYKFQTQSGKKGLIKINSITNESDGDAGAVVNATIKVLN